MYQMPMPHSTPGALGFIIVACACSRLVLLVLIVVLVLMRKEAIDFVVGSPSQIEEGC